MTKDTMRIIFFTIITLFFTSANAQQKTSKNSIAEYHIESLSDVELLNKAKSLRSIDQNTSVKLASEALIISRNNNNYPVSAQIHILLGKLNQEANNIDQSLYHFLQSSLIYKSINDTPNQIAYSIKHIELLLNKKNYVQAHKFIDELLPVVLKYGDKLSIALTLISKGNGYYQQKQYNDAVEQYTLAIRYLSDDIQVVHKHLARTYKLIAQSYKRLKDRQKTASFYKKSLDVYTKLKNKKLMARTLNTLSEAERYLGHLVIALEYSLRSLELHKQIDDPEGYVKALVGAGIIYRQIGRYEKSREHINEAHAYYKKINDVDAIAETSNQLGFIYSRLKQFDMARSFYQLSIDLSKKIKQKTLASALKEMAVIDLNDRNYESAMLMAKKAHSIYKQENDKSKGSTTARVIANIYNIQQHDAQAIKHYKESLSLANEENKDINRIKALNALGKILIGNNSDEGIGLLKKALALSIEIGDKNQRLSAYRNLHQAEKFRGNITEALRYAEEEIALSLIIQKEKEDNEYILEKASLYSHKMEMELELLREEARHDQLELAQKNNDIEIANQTRQITELELIKNQYASITLALLLLICVLLIVFIYRRFIASKKRNRELDYLAARDPLTNCYNRRILFERMTQDFENSELLDEYCIIMADIDHFKNINDTYGHGAGDSVICGVANILQGCVRQKDIVARFGGEEFCIVLHRVPQNQAMNIAEIMREKIEKSHFDDIKVTCSFGVTSVKFDAKAPSELIEQADFALYESKSLGRNQVTLWNPTLQSKVTK